MSEPKEGDAFAGTSRRHGTQSGWTQHQNQGERPCDACYRAKQEYDKRWREAPEQTRKNRIGARAQGRARSELQRLYPEVYRVLYEKHLAAVTQEMEEQ